MYGAVATTTHSEFEIDSPSRWKISRLFGIASLFIVLAFVPSSVYHQVPEIQQQVVFREPKVLVQRNGELNATLRIVPSLVDFGGNLSMVIRTFNGEFPGSTMVVDPGTVLRLTVVNELGGDICDPPINSVRCPNTTAIHIHGFHVSPETDDNVFQIVHPGETMQFVYHIPLNHPTGIFYIHPHFHGSSGFQTAYGMTSAVVVRDSTVNAGIEKDIVMMVGMVDIGSGKRSDVAADSKLSQSKLNMKLAPNIKETFLTVNGFRDAVIELQASKVYRFRIVNTIIDGSLFLNSGLGCSWVVTAADGINFQRPRSSHVGILIPPGSRRDILVQCIADSVIRSTFADSLAFLGNKTKIVNMDLFEIKSIGLPNTKPPLSLENAFTQTIKMSDLRNPNLNVSKRIIEYTQGGPSTPKVTRGSNSYTFYGINGVAFDGRSMFDVRLGQVQEWVIRNEYNMDGSMATESHPFHLHTNHFQVVSVASKGNFTADFEIGDWRDTISVPAPGNVTIRWKPLDFTGKTLLHCHTLMHEDTGMMQAFNIIE